MRGLYTLVQFVWIKQLINIEYAVALAQCLRPKVETDDRKFKAMKESFDKTTDIYTAWPSVISIIMHNYVMNILFHLEAMIDKVLTRLQQNY